METEIFREYVFSSHSSSEGKVTFRVLQSLGPCFNNTIMTPTTKRVKQALAGQKTCNPIFFFLDFWFCAYLSSSFVFGSVLN